MKTRCELCRTHLPGDREAWICSYECTYYAACRAGLGSCPNCAGELVPRPRRTTGATAVASRLPARITRKVGLTRGRPSPTARP
ncbi:DUF1272 domain-containing protein [Prescottella subtropica]|uniref:DUF1272 domain-containing protein n=1 Tax=Prescottella subtropica TaxID=2545757 RepID=UPI0010F71461|nr:DUF1272 domain-containing protein [Prescottella subtropica]